MKITEEIHESEVTVKIFKCKCGKARMKSVNVPNQKISRDVGKEHLALLAAGCDVITVSLEEGRKMEMCFKCKL